MLIPFCSKKEVAGGGLHKVLAENTTRSAAQVWRFSRQTIGTDLVKATNPVLPLRIKRELHPSSSFRILWSIGKEAKVQRP